VVASRWLVGGKAKAQGRGMGEGPSLAITTMFCLEFAYVVWLSVSMRKVAGEHPFCVLIYTNSYIFHIYFILFILLSHLIFDFACLTLSLADTHGIAKYARTYTRDTHTHAHTKPKKKVQRLVKEKEKKVERKNQKMKKWGQERKKGKIEKGGKEKEGKEGGNNADRHKGFSVFHHLQKDKQRKQRHSMKLGKKIRKSSKCNYYILSPKVIIKAIIIITRCEVASPQVVAMQARPWPVCLKRLLSRIDGS